MPMSVGDEAHMKGAIACIGECMIELSQLDLAGGHARLGFAGDTLNTAIYLSRLLPGRVSYVTNLGQDAFSTRMVEVFTAEGIDCTLVGRHQSLLPGLYSIEVDSTGERSFRYWRDNSAARTLFSGLGAAFSDLSRFGVIYLSGITLAILPSDVRAALIANLMVMRDAGHQIVFDSNYRPRLWADQAGARAAFAAMWKVCTLALPSFDDEAALYPGTSLTQVLDRIAAWGVPEIILKNGAAGPLIRQNGRDMQTVFERSDTVIDTTGAGDSFNAGYIASRLQGAEPEVAAIAGHELACSVIAQHGAIIPRQLMMHRSKVSDTKCAAVDDA